MQNNTFSGLIVGQNIVVLQSVDSTNNYLKRELSKSKPFPEGTVIMAEEQYAGRGQAQNQWNSEPGKNLTFSILLNPVFLLPENQFHLNIAVCLAINDVLRQIIGDQVKIKWPNDIYAGDDKIGGVLIENILRGSSWKHAIIGIGINVNQTVFPPDLRNVSSIRKILHQDYDLKNLLLELCRALQYRYLELQSGNKDQMTDYLGVLYRYREEHLYEISGVQRPGTIVGIDEKGKLNLSIEGSVSSFGFKEVSFVIPE